MTAALLVPLVLSGALVLYTYAGYPLMLAVLATVRPRPPREDPDHLPTVTLVIAAYDEEATIDVKLDNVETLDYPRERLQVLVAAQGSKDATAARARARSGVTALWEPERAGKAAALNAAAAAASGEILVFSDANNLYGPDTLRHLVAPFADPAVGLVSGRKQVGDDPRDLGRSEGLYWRYESRIKGWEGMVGSVAAVAGEVLAVRRRAFRPLPVGTVNDDLTLALMVAIDGWRLAYAPGALSFERASATIADEVRRRSRIVGGRWQALRGLLVPLALKRPLYAAAIISHKGLRPLVPFAMLIFAGITGTLALGHTWAQGLAGAQLAFYAAAVLGWLADRHGVRTMPLYVPYYFCRVNAAAITGLGRVLLARNQALWEKVARG